MQTKLTMIVEEIQRKFKKNCNDKYKNITNFNDFLKYVFQKN